MANRDVVTRSGKGTALDATDHDQNLSSLASTVEAQSGTTYTVVYTDQNKTIEFTNAGTKAVTLTAIATILGGSGTDTDSFHVTLRNTGAGDCTVSRSSTDTIEGATSWVIEQDEEITIETNAAGNEWIIKAHGGKNIGITGNLDVSGAIVANTGTFAATSSQLTTTSEVGGVVYSRVNDTDANGAAIVQFTTASLSTNDGAQIQNINSASPGYLQVLRYTGAGAIASSISLIENGNIAITPTGSGAVTIGTGTVQDTSRYSSALTVNPVTTGSNAAAHSLGTTPDGVDWYLECITIDGDFAVGDRIQPLNSTVSGQTDAMTCQWDATNVRLNVSTAIRAVGDSGTYAALTLSSWKVVFRAWTYT